MRQIVKPKSIQRDEKLGIVAAGTGKKNHMSFNEVEISRVKDYWNSRPCNVRHSTAPISTKEYFDQVEARKYSVEYHIVAGRPSAHQVEEHFTESFFGTAVPLPSPAETTSSHRLL